MKKEKTILAFATSLIVLIFPCLHIIKERNNDLHERYETLTGNLSTMGMKVFEDGRVPKFYPRSVFYLKVNDKEILIQHYYSTSTKGDNTYQIRLVDLSDLSLSEKVNVMQIWIDDNRGLPLGRQYFFINRFLPEIIDKYLSSGIDYYEYSSPIVTQEWNLRDYTISNKLDKIVAFTTFEGKYSDVGNEGKYNYSRLEMIIRFSSSESGVYIDVYCDPVVQHELKTIAYYDEETFSRWVMNHSSELYVVRLVQGDLVMCKERLNPMYNPY